MPGMAVSLDGPPEGRKADYSAAAQVARLVAELVLKNGLPPGILLNVNVPDLPLEKLSGYRITRQGLRIYREGWSCAMTRGRPVLLDRRRPPTGLPEAGTDFGALAGGFVSITPLHLDMTAHQAIPDLGAWEWETDNPADQRCPALRAAARP